MIGVCARASVLPKIRLVHLQQSMNLSSQVKNGFFRRAVRSKIVEAGQISETPITIGKMFAAGASLTGLGALAFYGLGLSKESGLIEHSAVWPSYVKERISSTYKYFGGGCVATALSAYYVSQSPTLMNIAMKNSIGAMIATIALVMGSGILVRSINYESFAAKHSAWLLHAGLIGGMIAPLSHLGGPLIMRAALYTAGLVGGLSIVAATAPSQKFLNMGGALSIGLGGVFAASLGSMFLPPTTRLGLSLYSISLYGGLVLFGMFLLYDTQKIAHMAQHSNHYDPINHSISIYLDSINIFIRMAQILAGQRRK